MLKGLGAIRQVSYLVHDVEDAMSYWTEVLGVGPFFFFEDAPIREFTYAGESTSAHLAGAFANSGAMQIELVQTLDRHPSVFNDALRRGHLGQHHVAFWTTELDASVERCATKAIHVLQTGYTGAPDGRFVYMGNDGYPGTVIEISEVQGRKRAFFDEVARAASNWDGSDPIRRMAI